MTRLKLYADPNSPIFVPENPNGSTCYLQHDMFAVIEKNKWEFVQDITQAQVIPCVLEEWDQNFLDYLDHTVREDQILMVMNLFHNDDHMTDTWFRGPSWDIVRNRKQRTLIVHNNNHDTLDPKYIFYDIMFNRQKYYMFDMEEDFYPESKVWTRNSRPEFYTAGPIEKTLSTNSKKILCLNRLYWDESIIKKQKKLRTMLQETFQNKDDVYLSDPRNNYFFYPNHSENNTIEVLTSGGTWYPAADIYYNTSYVNVYIESVVDSADGGNIFCASEKTYDPFVKGNFILPFSTPNFVNYLKSWYGFKFPDWIDYSYDEVTDFDQRVELYMESVRKVYSIDLETLHHHYVKDKAILEHNRNLINQLPYSSLHDKVVDSATQFGWIPVQNS
jgi:hypothetical protein